MSAMLSILSRYLPHPSALPELSPLATTLITISIVYMTLCSALRFHRHNTLYSKYPYGNGPFADKTFSAMSITEAHAIVKEIADLEFPSLFEKGLQFALFRTYGIPTISALLTTTRQLSSNGTVGKRYADTAVIVAEIYGCAPGSPRSLDAFSRLNYLHGNYFRRTTSGPRILEEDMLYTLALFMTQPVSWINRYEWRQLTDLELCAFGLFHLYMGTAMSIDFSFLPSGAKNGNEGNWTDGLHFYHELDEWSKAYEAKVMVPDQNNYDTAVHTRDLLTRTYPKFMHGFLSNFMVAMMDPLLRSAIKFPPAPAAYLRNINRFMSLRRFVLRWFTLPRIAFFATPFVTDSTSPKGHRWLSRYDTLPHYVKPTLLNRYGPSSWMSWIIGTPLPGDEGLQGQGWKIGDVGPAYFEGKGLTSFEMGKERLRKLDVGSGGCPFMVER